MHTILLPTVLGLCATFTQAVPRYPYRGHNFATGRKGLPGHGRLVPRGLELQLSPQNLVTTSFADPIALNNVYGPTVLYLFGEMQNSTASNVTEYVTGAVIPNPTELNQTREIIAEAVAQAKQNGNGVVLAVVMAQANSTEMADPSLPIISQVSEALAPPPVPAAYALLDYVGTPTFLSNLSATPGDFSIKIENALTGEYGLNPGGNDASQGTTDTSQQR